jgi:hypothetical protein
MARLRLLKMIVQPIYVIDDGETLVERPGPRVELSAAEVEDFPARYAAGFEELRQQFEGPSEEDARRPC